MTPVPFQDINAKAKIVTEALCRRWLPHGHRTGNWWVCSCPWRDDKKASLIVSLTSGHWEDRGGAIAGKEGGDLMKLYACLYPEHCKDMVDAADAVAQLVGHTFRKSRRS